MTLTNSLVVSISPMGQVEAMHLDSFDLGFLGNKKVQRASEITFNEDTQRWDILVPPEGMPNAPVDSWERNENACGFGNYEIARRAEVQWFNLARQTGTHPTSPEGLACLNEAIIDLACERT